MSYVGSKIIPFPHHGGAIPRVLWVVAHTLECEAIDGLGEELARGYFQNNKVSVHCVSDPGKTVAGLDTGLQAWHAGATANKYGLADEVTGRAGWPRSKWMGGEPRKAWERQAKAMAELGMAAGFSPGEYRWLSIPEVRSKSVRGMCGHVDLSLAFKESDHWDPGGPDDYPWGPVMSAIRWYAGVAGYWGEDPGTRPGDAPGGTGPGGAEGDWFANATDLDVALTCAGR